MRSEDIGESPWWSLLDRVSTLDAALLNSFHVTLDDLTQEEFRALLMLRAEREIYRDEEQKQSRIEAAAAEAQRRSASSF